MRSTRVLLFALVFFVQLPAAQAGFLGRIFGCNCKVGGSTCDIRSVFQLNLPDDRLDAAHALMEKSANNGKTDSVVALFGSSLDGSKVAPELSNQSTSLLQDYLLTGGIGNRVPRPNAAKELNAWIEGIAPLIQEQSNPQVLQQIANGLGRCGVGGADLTRGLGQMGLTRAGQAAPQARLWFFQLALISTLRNAYFKNSASMPTPMWSLNFFAGDPSGFRVPGVAELELIHETALQYLRPDQLELTQATGAVLVAFLDDLGYAVDRSEIPSKSVLEILLRHARARGLFTGVFERDFEFAETLISQW
jgi:hypothetical protein